MTARVCLLNLLLLACTTGALRAEESLEQRLLVDAADGRLDRFTLWEAATIASGGGRQLDELRSDFATILNRAVQSDIRKNSDKQRARRLFELMHRDVLQGEYQSDLNDFAASFKDGHYNCVTATVLFQGLCQACGLSPRAVAAPAHVYSRLTTDTVLNVETTCPTWFRLNPKRAKPSPPGRELSDVQLIGKIFYNEGVRLLKEKQFAEALRQVEISLILDPHDETAQANRLAALNNWALQCCNEEDFVEAVSLLDQGMSLSNDYQPFLANDLHVHQKWAQQLCRQGRYDEAIRLLHKRHLARPTVSLFDAGRVSVYQSWLSAIVTRGDYPGSLQPLRESRRLLADHPEVDDWRDVYLRNNVRRLHGEGRHREADRLADWAELVGAASSSTGSVLRADDVEDGYLTNRSL